ncbi:hypothetical protein RJD40_20920 [Vibrio scophthalmi]|uniref:hypothetical protein n=1 Tax=Vibrio scophthalmi TaxID=45658 RepID=UPI003AAD9D25
MKKQLGCDYVGHDFGAHYPDSTCIDGYLWDLDSGFAGTDGQHYLDVGGEIPCPKCNLTKYIKSYLSDDIYNNGYELFEHPLTTKHVKNQLRGMPSNMRRIAMRYWRAGRREAIKEARIEG